MENKDQDNSSKDTSGKNEANSDSSNEMLEHEKLIDPGNEHSHQEGFPGQGNDRSKHDADAGGDGTGTMGSKPE